MAYDRATRSSWNGQLARADNGAFVCRRAWRCRSCRARNLLQPRSIVHSNIELGTSHQRRRRHIWQQFAGSAQRHDPLYPSPRRARAGGSRPRLPRCGLEPAARRPGVNSPRCNLAACPPHASSFDGGRGQQQCAGQSRPHHYHLLLSPASASTPLAVCRVLVHPSLATRSSLLTWQHTGSSDSGCLQRGAGRTEMPLGSCCAVGAISQEILAYKTERQ